MIKTVKLDLPRPAIPKIEPRPRKRIADALGRDALEARQVPRHPARLRVAIRTQAEFVVEYTSNISAGGMFIRTEEELPVDSIVDVVVCLPDGGPPVGVDAKVIHIVPPGSARGPQGIGVQFIGIDDDFRPRLDAYIESIFSG